ncbi:MAG TPA: STAS domain-containing protein [Jiangellaceae bacterium]|nr:STAS domain-containing protein [Jiangellaceae bacterium]
MHEDRNNRPLTISIDEPGPANLQVTSSRHPDATLLRLTGELDIASAPRLVETMRSLSVPDMRHVRLDLTELTFIDASGIGVLVQVRMLVHGHGGRLTLHGIRPLLRRLLVITGLTSAFELESSLATLNDRSASPGSAALHGV